ncbi:hypothetical protein LAUMK4_05559 [Mycobacterium persicum]|uniref:Uncharacterized protein n=1 Tax=Mycobacterium persicum TaxID=1487726 RepID=A0AB38ULA7_9MYCO|nr:hypothetical protein LAUMK15_00289 [Mycobacterium persicum]VAZ81353.1 hypothetical protein LAUMK42_00154 [Mycobacterium persicum]VBA31720.1 hypothetical protein LAUMK4_05559 [Mycobacterium persicum]
MQGVAATLGDQLTDSKDLIVATLLEVARG